MPYNATWETRKKETNKKTDKNNSKTLETGHPKQVTAFNCKTKF